jgi:chemotaxis protein MotB
MASHRRHKGGHHEEEHENEERWLVSFADMMTLLFALFMVLFSISSVNTSKYQELQKSLQDAFSGAILSGGKSMMNTGASASDTDKAAPEPPLPAMRPIDSLNQKNTQEDQSQQAKQQAAQAEQQDLQQLKRRVDSLAKAAGLKGKVTSTVTRRGLVIQMLTDKAFFDSGSAQLQPQARPLLDRIAKVVAGEREHPVVVEGHTDSQPTRGSQYPTNWELSGARSAAVTRDLIANGVLGRRISGAFYADEEPISSNSTAQGRAKNRRVDIVLSRIH